MKNVKGAKFVCEFSEIPIIRVIGASLIITGTVSQLVLSCTSMNNIFSVLWIQY